MTERIQYRRGQKLPAGAKLVARPSRWGNAYKVSQYGRDEAIRQYCVDVAAMTPDELQAWLAPLRGARALACYCSTDEPCHADMLIELLDGAE